MLRMRSSPRPACAWRGWQGFESEDELAYDAYAAAVRAECWAAGGCPGSAAVKRWVG